jgi:hypothetical protein
MAKGNMLQGQATGKVGDIVFMVRNGQQVARVYTSAGGRSGDQASIAVRRQRVRFGAASNQYLLYRNIVRGMYRTGKSTKQSDYNYFVRENVDLLPYLTREENAAGVKCAMPGTFSRGTLGSLIFNYEQEETGGVLSSVSIASQNAQYGSAIAWDDTVGELKTALKSIFPNARKINFSVINVIKSEVDLPSGSQWSHTFDRADVTFDLFEEDATIPDSAEIKAYFTNYAPAALRSTIFNYADGNFGTTEQLFKLDYKEGMDDALFGNMLILVYATNDQVGDCYTSTLSTLNVAETDGGLSLYESLRTANHRQVAEDSYGYATGVMRTNIQQA